MVSWSGFSFVCFLKLFYSFLMLKTFILIKIHVTLGSDPHFPDPISTNFRPTKNVLIPCFIPYSRKGFTVMVNKPISRNCPFKCPQRLLIRFLSLQVRTHISRSLSRLDAGLGGVAGELHPLRWSTNPEEFTRSVQAGSKPNFLSYRQCCGSGSTSFWASWIQIRIHWPEVWIRIRIWILLSLSKNSKKNLDFYCFVPSFWLFTFENWCKSTFKKYRNMQKNGVFFIQFFVGILKVNDENRTIRIRIRIRIH
jgi:hypothetical protein